MIAQCPECGLSATAMTNDPQACPRCGQGFSIINRPCPCPVAVQVANKILDRADRGFKKYGATLDRGDLTLRDWANHLQEELMDATDYLQVIINKMDQLEKYIKE